MYGTHAFCVSTMSRLRHLFCGHVLTRSHGTGTLYLSVSLKSLFRTSVMLLAPSPAPSTTCRSSFHQASFNSIPWNRLLLYSFFFCSNEGSVLSGIKSCKRLPNFQLLLPAIEHGSLISVCPHIDRLRGQTCTNSDDTK